MEKSNQITIENIASIEGKKGLYRILKSRKTNLIVESIDKDKKRSIVDGRYNVSVLDKISIYDTGKDNKKDFIDVLKNIIKQYNNKIITDVNVKNNEELNAFMEKILPTYDKEKVYPSNIKKIIKWYNILIEFYPETITSEPKSTPDSKSSKEKKKKGKEKM